MLEEQMLSDESSSQELSNELLSQSPVSEITGASQGEIEQPTGLYAASKKYDYDNTPIVDIVNDMIKEAIDKGVSDIHFDPFEEGIHVRIRVDGDLHNFTTVPLIMKRNLITRIKIISGMNITESRVPQDGGVKGLIEGVNVDLRVSCLPTNMGEKIVIRILDYTMSSTGIENLGFTEKNLETVKELLKLPNGIILVTGATGSGKSTTVYSMLQRLNTENTNIITVEDPIEMNVAGINQVQVNSEIGMTFASALRSILRQDPDVIMIGEIRDSETAKIAVRSAITGHLVLSTIHTNDSLNTIERLLDMDVERYLLGAAFSGIISQKLVRRLCPKCKRMKKTSDYEKKVFKKALGVDMEEMPEAVGCSQCSGGYKGRLPIHEVLFISQEIKDAISEGRSKAELRKFIFSEGKSLTTMLQDGLLKIMAGDTTLEEVLRMVELDDEVLNSYVPYFTEDENAEEVKEEPKEEVIASEVVSANAPTPAPQSVNPITPQADLETFSF